MQNEPLQTEALQIDKLAKLIDRPNLAVEALPVTGRYPESKLTREVVKGVLGTVACVGFVVGVQPGAWFAVPLLIVGVMFAFFTLQQVRRFPLRLLVDETGLTVMRGSHRVTYRWGELKDFRLNYYANGRKASTGTLVVVLTAAKGRFKVDSSLDHFPTLLQRAALAAEVQELTLHPTTQANLEKLGLRPPSSKSSSPPLPPYQDPKL